MAVHLPRGEHRHGQRAGVSQRPAAQPAPHLRYGDELLLCAGAWRADLCDGGHGDAAQSLADAPRQVRGRNTQYSGARLLRPALRRCAPQHGGVRRLGGEVQSNRRVRSTLPPMPRSPSRAARCRSIYYSTVVPDLFDSDHRQIPAAQPGTPAHRRAPRRGDRAACSAG